MKMEHTVIIRSLNCQDNQRNEFTSNLGLGIGFLLSSLQLLPSMFLLDIIDNDC